MQGKRRRPGTMSVHSVNMALTTQEVGGTVSQSLFILLLQQGHFHMSPEPTGDLQGGPRSSHSGPPLPFHYTGTSHALQNLGCCSPQARARGWRGYVANESLPPLRPRVDLHPQLAGGQISQDPHFRPGKMSHAHTQCTLIRQDRGPSRSR